MILEAPKRKTGRKGGTIKISAGTGKDGLNLLQVKFVEYYTDLSNQETFGNGTNSYALAYNFDVKDSAEKKVAASEASRLLSNATVIQAISKELENLTLNDTVVDNRLAYLLNKFDDSRIMLGAITEYNRLKGRVKQNAGNTINVLSIQGLEESIKGLLTDKK